MSQVRRLWFPGPAGRLQAALRRSREERGAAVIAHPHPLYGGTLDNPVVFRADRGLSRAGFTSLRFNFRGVGTSEGEHDEGRGEVADLAAAVFWLRGIAPAVPLLLVGYSFGAWCAVRHAVDDPVVQGLIAIGLPVKLYPFEELERLSRPWAVVQGSEDEFGRPDEVREATARARPEGEVHVIDGASHLFPGRATDAAAAVVRAAEAILERIPA